MPKPPMTPRETEGKTSNPTDVMARMLYGKNESKYVILRSAQCLAGNKVRLTDEKGILQALREGGITIGQRQMGGMVLKTMLQEFDHYVRSSIPNASKTCFAPLTPELESWFSALPTKADLAWARLNRK